MAEYEPEHNGEYLAINIKTFLGTLSHSPEGAIMKAMERDPHGLYHLVRIGYTGAFKINHAKSKATSWVFG